MSNTSKLRMTRRIEAALCEHLGLDPRRVARDGLSFQFGYIDVAVTVTAKIPIEEFAEIVGSFGLERDLDG